MQTGIFAKTFPGKDPLTVLNAAKRAGYDCVQYNFACSGLPSMPETVPSEVMAAIEAARRQSGISIVALSATYNMIHPDIAVRKKGLAGLETVLSAASNLHIPLVTLCTGTRDPQDQWHHHPDNETPAAWADLVTEMTKAAALAGRWGVDLGIEPEQANVVRNASDTVRLMQDVPSERLKIVLDPANLFEQASADEARTIVSDAVSKLAGRIALAHAKDRDASGNFVTAGTGIVDFPDFITQLRHNGFDGPVVTHGLSADDAPGVARFLSGIIG